MYWIYTETQTKKIVKGKEVTIKDFLPQGKSFKTKSAMEKKLKEIREKHPKKVFKPCNLPSKLKEGEILYNYLGEEYGKVCKVTNSFYYIDRFAYPDKEPAMLLADSIKEKFIKGYSGNKCGLIYEVFQEDIKIL